MLVADLNIRRMLLPPLLAAAALVALVAVLDKTPRRHHPLLLLCFGLAVRAATSLGLTGAAPLTIAVVFSASVLAPWAASYWGIEVGIAAALLVGTLPIARWPAASVVLTVVAIFLYPWGRPVGGHTRVALRWIPAVVGVSLVAGALAPWGGIPVEFALPNAGAVCAAAVVISLVVTARLPPAAAGMVWFAAFLCLGPAQGPSPEGRTVHLSVDDPVVILPSGTGEHYVLDVSLRGARNLPDGTPVATVEVGGQSRVLRVGHEVVDLSHEIVGAARSIGHSLPEQPVWRPSRVGYGARWRVAGRTVLDVDPGELPILRRHQHLPERIRVAVEAAGPSGPTPPRGWTLPAWLVVTASVVALIQLASGAWRWTVSLVPWCLLVTGQIVARAWVEPLRLAGERYGVDLCFAALVAAWLPAAWRWLRSGRTFWAMAALFVPLALATPHLTPALYGDEPFHLAVMESLRVDHDLAITNNLDIEHVPSSAFYAKGDPLFHSPVLAMLLLPGYLVAGRSGALIVLALAGAAAVALIRARGDRLGVPTSRLMLLVLGLALTYPLATYTTQVWPELAGALAVAAILVLSSGYRLAGWWTTVIALVATAIKTRLALVTFPTALATWMKGDLRRVVLGVAVLGMAAALGLAVGWFSMGHPFGYYRRLAHLVPEDPVVAVRAVGGLLFDPAGGLAFAAPLLLVAIASVAALWRRGGDGERAVVFGGALTVLALLHSIEWYGGGSPPARYLVPLLPALSLTWGLILTVPFRWRRLGEVLLAPSLVVWWALVTRPHFSVNPGDGGWWLVDVLARRFRADVQQFFPSFLVPTTATAWFPPIVVVLAFAAVWLGSRHRATTRLLVRVGLSLWLVACAALAVAVTSRCDRVVEVEAPQVRRRGGKPVPPTGTFSRFTYRNGWQLADGESVVIPLKLPARASLQLEGWLLGTAQRGAELAVRWDDGPATNLPVAGRTKDGRLQLPEPPGSGRHRLRISVSAPEHGAVVLDRVLVQRLPAR
jgi:hypothetical protein